MGCGGSKESGAGRGAAGKYQPHHGSNFGHGAEDMQMFPAGGAFTGGPLTAKEYKERLVTSEGTQSVHLPRANYTIRYAYVSQRGYYPDSPDKQNQDSFCVHTCFNGDPEQHLFGVFDGHGDCGTQSSQFARDKVPLNMLASAHFGTNPALAFHQAMVATNMQCHRSDFDDSMSGTTAISVLIRGRSVLVANVGDSRAVLGEKRSADNGGGYMARDLSIDQTPYRRDECARVKAAGARVLTLDQIEGLKDPEVECWTTEEDDDGDPPRLWFPNGMYPGTAFTRSIGDAAAERIGVFAEPELEFRYLGANDAFLVIASDGVFEFISSQRVVDMVSKFDDPHEACLSVVAESYRLWLQYETRTDDITMIVLQFSGLESPQQPPPGSLSRVSLTGQPASPPIMANGAAPPPHQEAAAAAAGEDAQQAAATAASQQQQQQQPQTAADGFGAPPGLPGGQQGPGTPGFPPAAAQPQQQQQQPQQQGVQQQLQQQQHHRHPSGLPVPLRGHLVEDIEPGGGGALLTPMGSSEQPQHQPPPQQQLLRQPTQQQREAARAAARGAGSISTAAAVAAAAAALMAPQAKPELGTITPDQYKMLEDTLRTNFLFNHLSESERLTVYKRMERLEVQPGQVVIRQGERGDHFCVAEKGVYDVLVSSQPMQQQQQQHQHQPSSQQQQQAREQHARERERQQQQLLLQQRQLSGGSSSGGGGPKTQGSVLLDNDLMAELAASAADEAILAAYAAEDEAAAAAAAAEVADAATLPPAAADAAGSGSSSGAALAAAGLARSGSSSSAAGAAAAGGAAGGRLGLLGGVETELGELVHTYVAPPVGGGLFPTFGELALLYGKPRAATVVAQTPGILWRLSRGDFRAAVAGRRSDPAQLLLRCLGDCEVLEPLTSGQRMAMADLMRPRAYEDGEVIGHAGDVYDDFCIVAQGAVAAVVRKGGSQPALSALAAGASGGGGASTLQQLHSAPSSGSVPSGDYAAAAAAAAAGNIGTEREVLTMGPGAFFGERALLEPRVTRPASMVAKGQTLLLAVTRAQFEAALGPLPQLAREHDQWAAWLAGQRDLLTRTPLGPRFAELLEGKFNPHELEMHGVLWMLNEAIVLAGLQGPTSGVSLAARLFSVEVVEARGLGAAVASMRRITAQLPPCLFVPHTVRAWYSPPADGDSSGGDGGGGGGGGGGKDAAAGGRRQQQQAQGPPAVVAGEALATAGVCTLAALLQEGPLDERSSAYIAAMVLLGLHHLHCLGITYRGLSAITLLITESGLVQLVDFRFATDRSGRCYTLCGVPEYLAPEVVGGTGHDESCDWWALGVLIYHLITGGTPFAQLGDDELRIYRRILRSSYAWPDTPAGHDVSADARDLVGALLARDPRQRLGMGHGGVARLRAHPWFRHLHWEDLQEGRTMMPLGLRERLFKCAAGADLGGWAPPPRGSMTQAPAADARANPAWLEEF